MKVRIAMIYEKVLKERDRLELKMIEIEKQLKELPEGKLFCVSNGKYYKWFYQTFITFLSHFFVIVRRFEIHSGFKEKPEHEKAEDA